MTGTTSPTTSTAFAPTATTATAKAKAADATIIAATMETGTVTALAGTEA